MTERKKDNRTVDVPSVPSEVRPDMKIVYDIQFPGNLLGANRDYGANRAAREAKQQKDRPKRPDNGDSL